ncbi:MAG: CD225/dispanin family protein [Micromonosporaceae bacterium]|nr:CD225/dispanin family protein [Micromonosporaceae bacterium]
MAYSGYPPPPPPQGPYSQPQGQPPSIDNNMTMSIVAIFLFWPLAIPAIINASKVNPALQAGDWATAQHASTESKKWSKLALIIGIIWYAVAIVCCIIYFVAIANATSSVNSY